MNKVIKLDNAFQNLLDEFANNFKFTYCYSLGELGSYWILSIEERQIPDYIQDAIKKEHIKDIKTIRISWSSISITVIFKYIDNTTEEFISYKIGKVKYDKLNAARILEWMMNLKYLHE